MKATANGALVAVACLAVGTATAGAADASMDAQQLYLFQHAYPDAELIFDCKGNFTGASDKEHVLGFHRPGEKPRRVGLVLDSGKWLFHDIEQELKADKLPPRHWAQSWEAPPGGAAPKCNVDPRHDPDLSDHGKTLGDVPFFTLRPGLAAACFGTSEQYNNWDCIAYRNGRFSLWYQQVFAD
jgi:hypothetical protein